MGRGWGVPGVPWRSVALRGAAGRGGALRDAPLRQYRQPGSLRSMASISVRRVWSVSSAPFTLRQAEMTVL